jgi:hypothetical protein
VRSCVVVIIFFDLFDATALTLKSQRVPNGKEESSS